MLFTVHFFGFGIENFAESYKLRYNMDFYFSLVQHKGENVHGQVMWHVISFNVVILNHESIVALHGFNHESIAALHGFRSFIIVEINFLLKTWVFERL